MAWETFRFINALYREQIWTTGSQENIVELVHLHNGNSEWNHCTSTNHDDANVICGSVSKRANVVYSLRRSGIPSLLSITAHAYGGGRTALSSECVMALLTLCKQHFKKIQSCSSKEELLSDKGNLFGELELGITKLGRKSGKFDWAVEETYTEMGWDSKVPVEISSWNSLTFSSEG